MSHMVTRQKTSMGEIIIDCDIEKAKKYKDFFGFMLMPYGDSQAWVEYNGEKIIPNFVIHGKNGEITVKHMDYHVSGWNREIDFCIPTPSTRLHELNQILEAVGNWQDGYIPEGSIEVYEEQRSLFFGAIYIPDEKVMYVADEYRMYICEETDVSEKEFRKKYKEEMRAYKEYKANKEGIKTKYNEYLRE